MPVPTYAELAAFLRGIAQYMQDRDQFLVSDIDIRLRSSSGHPSVELYNIGKATVGFRKPT